MKGCARVAAAAVGAAALVLLTAPAYHPPLAEEPPMETSAPVETPAATAEIVRTVYRVEEADVLGEITPTPTAAPEEETAPPMRYLGRWYVTGYDISYAQTASNAATSAAADRVGAEAALQGAQTAQEAAEDAATQADEAAQGAGSSAASAVLAATSAEQAAGEADESATLAESYTHGGTGTRSGEDTDNAKYYMERARDISGGDFVTRTEFDTELAVVSAATIQAMIDGTYVPANT